MAARYAVSGEEHRSIRKRMDELMRQMESPSGAPHDPQRMLGLLQSLNEHAMPLDMVVGVPNGTSHTKPVHGLFTDVQGKVLNLHKWNEKYGWGLDESAITRMLDVVPDWPSRRLVTVTLVPYFKTPYETFRWLLKVATDEAWLSRVGSRLMEFREDRVRITGVPHKPGLRWEVINLGGHAEWGEDNRGLPGNRMITAIEMEYQLFRMPSFKVRPNAGILAELAHSPWLGRALDPFNGSPWLAATGYEVRYWSESLDQESWGVPYFFTPIHELEFRNHDSKFGKGWVMEICDLAGEVQNKASKISSPVLLATAE